MDYRSPAKLNLYFRILKKRSDGYHEIESLFQAIDLFDTITLKPSDRDRITSDHSNLPLDETNLIWKARELFKSRFGSKPVHIHLQKKIPMQAGLGGGSSNAATVLWALNVENNYLASIEELIKLGAILGSDVSFFFSNGTAHCSGRGEKLRPHSLEKQRTGWIIKPDFGLSTEEVFKEVRRLRGNFHTLDYDAYCDSSQNPMREINLEQFTPLLENNSVRILDLREFWEQPQIDGELVIKVPIPALETSLHLIPKTEDLIVMCQHGVRSRTVIELLQSRYKYKNLINLQGGITGYVRKEAP